MNRPGTQPAAVAGQVAMLDHMLDGRRDFGIPPGGPATDAEAFGPPGEDRGATVLGAIDMVLET